MLRINICQLAELMERNGSECVPVEPEKGQDEKAREEKTQEEKTEGLMELKTRFGTTEHVTLAAGVYAENGGLSVEMVSVEDGFREPYGSVTVNLSVPVPPYCAFVDTNNMPEAVGFLAKNGIARPTGLQRQSGYCVYPLYQFDAEKMRGLCPDGMAAYERENGDGRKAEKRKKGR